MDLVAGAVGSIVSKLGALLQAEYKLQKGLQEQIEYLKNELESAHTALCEVGATPPEQLHPQVRLWAQAVREASYDMEDILDTFLVDVEGAAPAETKSKKDLLRSLKKKMAKLLKKSKARHNIAGAIEGMKKRLQEVSDRRNRYSVPVAVPSPVTKVDPRLVDMHKEAAQIIGIERTKAELIAKLQSASHVHGDAGVSDNSNKMVIVSVVGAGGLGKTTLAKAVYDELSPGYDCRAFVSVGRNPNLVQVFTSIFFHVDRKEYEAIRDIKDLQLLIGALRKFLENKRFLIVIDDVWDVKSWEALGSALDQKNSGSRIIKTTRNLEVACSDEVYQLAPLTPHDSKKLFYMRLFGGEDKCPANHPEEASEKILEKCGGVPLAIITMASLLVGKSSEDWFEVCNSPGFYRGRENKQVDDTVWILSLSYHDLPSHLKTCLLYLSVYPEDYKIEKHSLIWKWVAEGFIEKKTGTSQFQRGEEYFHQLINRSMIQGVVESGLEGIIDGCRVHDMVLDLIRGLAREENFITFSDDDGGASSRHKVRRLAQPNRRQMLDESHHDSDRDMTQLRSLVAHGCNIWGLVLHPRFKLIRVLSLERCTPSNNDEYDRHWLQHLGKLVHLRYLGLRGTKVRELPEAIGALKLLQTLDLEDTVPNLPVQLPSSVSLLTRLVCLRCDFWMRAPPDADGFLQKLTSLEELRINVRDLCFESNKRQFFKDLGNLSQLRVLHVLGTGGLYESMQEELLKSLGNLQKLQDLYLGGFPLDGTSMEWDKAVLSKHLRHLSISSINFPCVPSFIDPRLLPSLSDLELCVDHIDEAGLRALGGLPELRYLRLIPRHYAPSYYGPSHDQAAVVNIAAHDVFFLKLRSLWLPGWMVQLATNKYDSACASFSIWNWKCPGQHAMVFTPSQAEAPVVMPNLQELQFTVPSWAFYRDGHDASCDNNNLGLDLECLPSLRVLRAELLYRDFLPDDFNKAAAELRRVVQFHPNRFALRFHVKSVKIPLDSDEEEYYKFIPRSGQDEVTDEDVSEASL